MKILERDIYSLSEIKDNILASKGKQILIKEFNRQGKKVHEYNGQIMDTYQNLFLVKVSLNNYFINKSFSYADMVTNEWFYEICED